MARRCLPRRATPDDDDDHVSETDPGDVEVDENTPVNDENAFHPAHASPLLALRTPLSHARSSHDTALCNITDQFFHPPSPSPVRISKLKLPVPPSIEPPRRPKKPRSLAYPADPPNWLYARSSLSLPPSSPFPPSTTNVDYARLTDRRREHPDTPSRASDSDPFGFIAVERAIKAKRGPSPAPRKPAPRTNAVKSPPRSTVLASSSLFTFSQPEAPMATNNEDIDELYADEPVAGPSDVHVPAAPLLRMNSDQSFIQPEPAGTFPDPLRTPRKRKRRASPSPDEDPDLDDQGTDIPSSPSPVKISVAARPSYAPIPKLTRAQGKAAAKPPAAHASRTRRVAASHQNIPTPSSTRPSPSARQLTAPPTPVPPRRSTRRAAAGARAKLKGATSDAENEDGSIRMTLRSRSVKANETTARAKHPPTKAKASTRVQKTSTSRPRGKSNVKNVKNAKGKGKARPSENVLDLSDDTLERYEKERRERLQYFKRLEGYQIQKENVYVV